MLESLICFWVLQTLYGVVKAWTSGRLLLWQDDWLNQAAAEFPKKRVALVISVKGLHDHFDQFLEFVLRQDYANYRVIFAVESEEDPAYSALQERLESGSYEVVVAGLAESQGQKVQNQLAAFAQLSADDEIVAFADADMMGEDDWLTKLVTPLNTGRAELTSGYRWFIPQNRNTATRVAAQINAGVAMFAGPNLYTLLWGGSMAMTRQTFDDIDVTGRLQGSLSDDLQISWTARKAKKRLFFVRSLMVPSPVSFSWRSLFEFGRRQYFQLRVYTSFFWVLALGLTSLYLVGGALTLYQAIQGEALALLALGAVLVLEMVKVLQWKHFMGHLFHGEVLSQARRGVRWAPLYIVAIHFAIILSSAFIRTITWAGIKYHVKSRQDVKVLSR